MTWHKFINSYYCFRVWISTSLIRIIIISKSKTSYWLGTSLLTVITISEFELAQVHKELLLFQNQNLVFDLVIISEFEFAQVQQQLLLLRNQNVVFDLAQV